jgi:hypothetical protein
MPADCGRKCACHAYVGIAIGAIPDERTTQTKGRRKMTNAANTRSFYGDFYDCTDLIGPHDSDKPWPMYSYERPAYLVWNAIAGALHKRGWTDSQIKDWLQSKQARWALDGELGEAIQDLGDAYANKHIKG